MALKYTNGFKTSSLKLSHYQDHVEDKGEFDCQTPDEYEALADKFCGKPLTPDIKVYTRKYGAKAGDVVKWDSVTDEYSVLSNSGHITTYFRVNYLYGTNQDYFDLEQVKDEERKP
jgi:hypothetical protein